MFEVSVNETRSIRVLLKRQDKSAKLGTSRNQNRPPKIGPLAYRVWNSEQRRWIVRLNDEGRKFVEDFYRDFDGKPAKMLSKSHASLVKLAIAEFDYDTVNAECYAAIVETARHFDPAKGFQKTTYTIKAMARRLRNLITGKEILRAKGTKPENREYLRIFERKFIRPDMVTTSDDLLITWGEIKSSEGNEGINFKRIENAELLRMAFDTMNRDDLSMVQMYYFEGKTLENLGLHFGLTKERIRQKIKNALFEARLAVAKKTA